MDHAALDRLDATLAVLQQDHQSTDHNAIANDTLTPVGDVFGLDALDLDLLLVAAAPDVDANLALAYGLLRGTTGPERPTVGLALELAGISTMSPLAVAKLGESGGLRRAGLIQSAADGSWLARELWCPDRVVAHLQGWTCPTPNWRRRCSIRRPCRWPAMRTSAGHWTPGSGWCGSMRRSEPLGCVWPPGPWTRSGSWP